MALDYMALYCMWQQGCLYILYAKINLSTEINYLTVTGFLKYIKEFKKQKDETEFLNNLLFMKIDA